MEHPAGRHSRVTRTGCEPSTRQTRSRRDDVRPWARLASRFSVLTGGVCNVPSFPHIPPRQVSPSALYLESRDKSRSQLSRHGRDDGMRELRAERSSKFKQTTVIGCQQGYSRAADFLWCPLEGVRQGSGPAGSVCPAGGPGNELSPARGCGKKEDTPATLGRQTCFNRVAGEGIGLSVLGCDMREHERSPDNGFDSYY